MRNRICDVLSKEECRIIVHTFVIYMSNTYMCVKICIYIYVCVFVHKHNVYFPCFPGFGISFSKTNLTCFLYLLLYKVVSDLSALLPSKSKVERNPILFLYQQSSSKKKYVCIPNYLYGNRMMTMFSLETNINKQSAM